MKFTIETKQLKERGYIFQKLFARNYKTYRKAIKEYTIWLWVLEHSIEIKDWHEHTEAVLNFFKNNIEENQRRLEGTTYSKDYMRLRLNRKTGEVIFKDFEMLQFEDTEAYDTKWTDWEDIILGINTFQEVVKEVNILTGQK